VLIGRGDLAMAYGVDFIDKPLIENAVRNIVLAVARSGIP
jgi:hypothetical protein